MGVNVEQHRFDEGISQLLDPVDDPRFKIEELSLASYYGQGDRKFIIVPSGEGDQTISNRLCDVENPGKIEGVFFLAFRLVDFADCANDQVLIGLP